MGLKLNTAVFGTEVTISRSGETGKVTGFALYQRSKGKQFLVSYTDALGRATDAWFFEDELSAEEA